MLRVWVLKHPCQSAVSEKTGHPAAHALARYRCFLPDLAGLAGLRRAGPRKTDFNTFVSFVREKPGCVPAKFSENSCVAASGNNLSAEQPRDRAARAVLPLRAS